MHFLIFVVLKIQFHITWNLPIHCHIQPPPSQRWWWWRMYFSLPGLLPCFFFVFGRAYFHLISFRFSIAIHNSALYFFNLTIASGPLVWQIWNQLQRCIRLLVHFVRFRPNCIVRNGKCMLRNVTSKEFWGKMPVRCIFFPAGLAMLIYNAIILYEACLKILRLC